MAYDVKDDGSVANGRIFFDAEKVKKPGLKGGCDGMKVDAKGNVFRYRTRRSSRHLVRRQTSRYHSSPTSRPETAALAALTDPKLYICADMYLARVKTKTKGKGL
jgi:gluconolactonase